MELANLHFEPAIHYYVARRVFHVVYISIVFRWLFKVNRNTPRGGDTRVKQAKEGSLLGFPIGEGPSRLEPYSSHLVTRLLLTQGRNISSLFFLFLFFLFSPVNRFYRRRSLFCLFGLEQRQWRRGGEIEICNVDDSEETALRKEEVEIDNYREFLIRVYIGVRTSSMIYRVVSDLVLNVYRSCR